MLGFNRRHLVNAPRAPQFINLSQSHEPVEASKSKFCLEPDWPYFGGCGSDDGGRLLI